jgi:hypothetical protein
LLQTIGRYNEEFLQKIEEDEYADNELDKLEDNNIHILEDGKPV